MPPHQHQQQAMWMMNNRQAMMMNDDVRNQRMMILNCPAPIQQQQQQIDFAPLPSTFHRPYFQQMQMGAGDYFDDTPTPLLHNQRNFDIVQPSSPDVSDTDSAHNMGGSTSSLKRDLLSTDEITSDDVLCGRGAGANTHAGNIKFRSFVGDYQHAYLSAKPLDKANIAKGIASKITEKGGRFLKRSTEKGLTGKGSWWYDIGFKAAREKTCQALRERAPSTFDIPMNKIKTSATNKAAPDVSSGRQVAAAGAEGVNDHDILLGRGGVTNSHRGNKHFRTLVRQHQREYLAAPKLKKAAVAQNIVDKVYGEGGRFLTERQGKWVEVSKEKAREKTSQALREKAPELRKIYHAAQELVAKKVAEKRRAQQQEQQHAVSLPLFQQSNHISYMMR